MKPTTKFFFRTALISGLAYAVLTVIIELATRTQISLELKIFNFSMQTLFFGGWFGFFNLFLKNRQLKSVGILKPTYDNLNDKFVIEFASAIDTRKVSLFLKGNPKIISFTNSEDKSKFTAIYKKDYLAQIFNIDIENINGGLQYIKLSSRQKGRISRGAIANYNNMLEFKDMLIKYAGVNNN